MNSNNHQNHQTLNQNSCIKSCMFKYKDFYTTLHSHKIKNKIYSDFNDYEYIKMKKYCEDLCQYKKN